MLGDVVKINDDTLYVLVDYIDHNSGDYGACSYNEEYMFMELDRMNILIDHYAPHPIPEEELKKGILTRTRKGLDKSPFTVITDIPPFVIEEKKYFAVRQKRAKTVTVYE